MVFPITVYRCGNQTIKKAGGGGNLIQYVVLEKIFKVTMDSQKN